MKPSGKPRIIVVTGAESTGKSVLTRQLGEHFGAPFYPEYAREYLEKCDPHYTFNDVIHIAMVQAMQMEEAKRHHAEILFFDTWLIITKVWLEVVYGKVPAWIHEVISTAPISLFLLCDTGLPWEPDPLRENGGEMREKLSAMYKANLEGYGFHYGIVTGRGNERIDHALQIIRQFT